MKINNYNSAAPLSDYTEGTAYTFYIRNDNLPHLVEADSRTVSRYAPVIDVLVNNKDAGGQWMNFTRAAGIVVDKHMRTESRDVDYLVVMFKKEDGRYVLNNYIVDHHNVFTNDRDLVTPSVPIRL